MIPSRTPARAALALAFAAGLAGAASAQDCMLGEVRLFAGEFAPDRWVLADGSLLQINKYTALFSVIGTAYGGDGRTTFALPDMRGRSPLLASGGGAPAWSKPAAEVTNHLVCMEGYYPQRR